MERTSAFKKKMRARPDKTGYFLSAFLSATLSVTFLLRKELAQVAGFRQRWEAQRLVLGAHAMARFLMELRNFSQKEGRVSLTGGRTGQGRSTRWTFRFVGVQTSAPDALQGVDAADACQAGALSARLHGGLPVSNLSQVCPERCWRASIGTGRGGDFQSPRLAAC